MEQLNWEVIHKSNFDENDDFLKKILESKGVFDTDALLNVSAKDTHSSFLLENIENGIQALNKAIESKSKIYLQVDSDADGYTSASIIYQFIKELNSDIDIIFGIHEGKQHGLFYEDIKSIDNIGLFIVPDASIEIDEIKLLRLHSKSPILILDHHQMNDKLNECENVILINCNDGSYPNNTLSGAGVVFKFLIAYEDKFKTKNIVNEYLDLVALGNIADSMDLKNLETRYYVLEGLKEENRKNLFMRELSERLAEDMKLGHTITNYGWVIAPKINGCIRFGKYEEKVDLFRAMIGECQDSVYQPRKKRGAPKTDPVPEKEVHTLQKTMARVACNAKGRQDNSVREIMKKIDAEITRQGLQNDSVIIVDGTELVEEKTLTGLIANKLASKYHRPIVILKKRKEENTDSQIIYGGSGRAYSEGKIKNFKDFLEGLNVFDKCAGHQGAFGVEITEKNIGKARDKANEKLEKKDLITIHKVDYEIEGNKLKNTAIEQVANSFWIWGNGISEPTFAITNIKINAKEIISYGENKGFIKFTYNGVDYIKKYCPKGDFENMTLHDRTILGENRKELILTVIGTFTYNAFNDNFYPQVRIKHFHSIERKEELNINDVF